jgi:hypothetical protein
MPLAVGSLFTVLSVATWLAFTGAARVNAALVTVPGGVDFTWDGNGASSSLDFVIQSLSPGVKIAICGPPSSRATVGSVTIMTDVTQAAQITLCNLVVVHGISFGLNIAEGGQIQISNSELQGRDFVVGSISGNGARLLASTVTFAAVTIVVAGAVSTDGVVSLSNIIATPNSSSTAAVLRCVDFQANVSGTVLISALRCDIFPPSNSSATSAIAIAVAGPLLGTLSVLDSTFNVTSQSAALSLVAAITVASAGKAAEARAGNATVDGCTMVCGASSAANVTGGLLVIGLRGSLVGLREVAVLSSTVMLALADPGAFGALLHIAGPLTNWNRIIVAGCVVTTATPFSVVAAVQLSAEVLCASSNCTLEVSDNHVAADGSRTGNVARSAVGMLISMSAGTAAAFNLGNFSVRSNILQGHGLLGTASAAVVLVTSSLTIGTQNVTVADNALTLTASSGVALQSPPVSLVRVAEVRQINAGAGLVIIHANTMTVGNIAVRNDSISELVRIDSISASLDASYNNVTSLAPAARLLSVTMAGFVRSVTISHNYMTATNGASPASPSFAPTGGVCIASSPGATVETTTISSNTVVARLLGPGTFYGIIIGPTPASVGSLGHHATNPFTYTTNSLVVATNTIGPIGTSAMLDGFVGVYVTNVSITDLGFASPAELIVSSTTVIAWEAAVPALTAPAVGSRAIGGVVLRAVQVSGTFRRSSGVVRIVNNQVQLTTMPSNLPVELLTTDLSLNCSQAVAQPLVTFNLNKLYTSLSGGFKSDYAAYGLLISVTVSDAGVSVPLVAVDRTLVDVADRLSAVLPLFSNSLWYRNPGAMRIVVSGRTTASVKVSLTQANAVLSKTCDAGSTSAANDRQLCAALAVEAVGIQLAVNVSSDAGNTIKVENYDRAVVGSRTVTAVALFDVRWLSLARVSLVATTSTATGALSLIRAQCLSRDGCELQTENVGTLAAYVRAAASPFSRPTTAFGTASVLHLMGSVRASVRGASAALSSYATVVTSFVTVAELSRTVGPVVTVENVSLITPYEATANVAWATAASIASSVAWVGLAASREPFSDVARAPVVNASLVNCTVFAASIGTPVTTDTVKVPLVTIAVLFETSAFETMESAATVELTPTMIITARQITFPRLPSSGVGSPFQRLLSVLAFRSCIGRPPMLLQPVESSPARVIQAECVSVLTATPSIWPTVPDVGKQILAQSRKAQEIPMEQSVNGCVQVVNSSTASDATIHATLELVSMSDPFAARVLRLRLCGRTATSSPTTSYSGTKPSNSVSASATADDTVSQSLLPPRTETPTQLPTRTASQSRSAPRTQSHSMLITDSSSLDRNSISEQLTLSLGVSASYTVTGSASPVPPVQTCEFDASALTAAVPRLPLSSTASAAGGLVITLNIAYGTKPGEPQIWASDALLGVTIRQLPLSGQQQLEALGNERRSVAEGHVFSDGWIARRGEWRATYNAPSSSSMVVHLPAMPSVAPQVVPENFALEVGSAAFACDAGPSATFSFTLEPSTFDALSTAEAASTATAVLTSIASVAGGTAAAASGQSLAVLALVSCSSPAAKKAAGPLKFLLSPLGDVFGEGEIAAIVANLILMASVVAAQVSVTGVIFVLQRPSTSAKLPGMLKKALQPALDDGYPWRCAMASARFPGMSIFVAVFCQQGNAVFSMAGILDGDVSAVRLCGLAVAVSLPLLIFAISTKCTRPTFEPGPDSMIFYRYTQHFALWPSVQWPRLRKLYSWVVPIGRWGPVRRAKMYAPLFRHIRPVWIRTLVAMPVVQPLLLGTVAALPVSPDAVGLCTAQVVVLGLMVLGLSLVGLVRPFRSPFENYAPVVSGVVTASAFFASAKVTYTSLSEDTEPPSAALDFLAFATILQGILALVQSAVAAALVALTVSMWAEDGRTVPFLETDGVSPIEPEAAARRGALQSTWAATRFGELSDTELQILAPLVDTAASSKWRGRRTIPLQNSTAASVSPVSPTSLPNHTLSRGVHPPADTPPGLPPAPSGATSSDERVEL